jgi:alpha-L-arabinofuranosidase
MKLRLLLLTACSLMFLQKVDAQAPLLIYTDNLVNDFQNWSWATVNFANTSPVYSGSDSISVTTANYSALSLYYPPGFNTALYTNLSFWINGGTVGGQVINVVGEVGGDAATSYTLPRLTTFWQQYTIPLSTLGAANKTNCNGFLWQSTIAGSAPTFYVDAVQLNPVPAPSLTHIAINAAQSVRTADTRWFGINTAVWDGYFDTAETISQLNEAALTTLRFPGGSEADVYNWATDMSLGDDFAWATSFDDFAHVATNIGAQVIITVNYGTGTPAEAAAWVADSNVTNNYGFKYWEIGNELYGTWETDSNTYPHDPYTYATRVQSYIQQMKAVATNIKVGVVVVNGEDTDSNGYTNHPATNSATGQVHYGWTPVLLSTLKSLGVTPDFAIFHWYPQSGSDSDPLLLQGTGSWTPNAANLRMMITDYFGPGGTNIELLCTENNNDSGPEGKQSVSLVNAIYYADSLGQLMQTEFNSFCWWDLRNGQDTSGDNDPSLYGWRIYGDFGVMNGQAADLPDRYPPFFSAKLMQYFVRGGDTVLAATSSYSLLSAYATRRTNGALTLLVINKNPVSDFTAQIALDSFTPSPAASIYSYGMPQDDAAETGTGSCDIAQTNFSAATTNFNYTFAPYSLTVFVFAPVAPSLMALPPQPGSGQLVLQLAGQSGTPYVLQTSTDLAAWTPVSTNVPAASPLNITNTLIPGAEAQFWRAVWVP